MLSPFYFMGGSAGYYGSPQYTQAGVNSLNVPSSTSENKSGGLPNLPGSSFIDGFSDITSGINSFGVDLGFSSGVSQAAPSASFVGPMAPAEGSVFGANTLISGVGNIAGGAGLGGLAASLTGGNPTTGAIAGGVGSAGAMALGATGPVGLAAGAVAGLVGGKIFGKKEPHPASTFGSFGNGKGLDDSGAIIEPQFQSKHLDNSVAQQVYNSTNKFTQALSKVSGLKLSNINSIQGGYDRKQGFLSLGDYKGTTDQDKNATYWFDAKNPQAFSETLQNKFGPEVLRRAAAAQGIQLTPEQISQFTAQALAAVNPQQQGQSSVTGYGGITGPTITARMGKGPESFSDFVKRHRETGAVNPDYTDKAK